MTEGAWSNLRMYRMQTRKDLAGARAAFEESLKLRPDYYSPMFNLALLYREKGDTRAAEEWLFRSLAAVRSDPAPALAGWAHDDEKAGRLGAARSLLERAAKTFPDNEVVARERALFLYRQKDCRGAAAALSGFEGATTDARTLNDLALIETCLADKPAVIRLLERSLALKPDQPEVAQALERLRRSD